MVGKGNALFFAQLDHTVELIHLVMCGGLITLISSCEIRKDPLHYHMRHCRDLCNGLCAFFVYLQTDPAHAGIRLDVYIDVFAKPPGNVR